MDDFEKMWQDAVDSYETIPDKTKIKYSDKQFARGFYEGVRKCRNILADVLFDIDTNTTSGKKEKEIAEKHFKELDSALEGLTDELLTSILDNYVE